LLRSGRFDLVHSHGLTAGVYAAMANWRIGVPHVVTSHDVFRPDQFSGLTGRIKRVVLSRLLGRADAIVSVSNGAQQNLLNYLPSLARSHCQLVPILNGIDTRRFARAMPPESGGLRSQLGLLPNTFLIGFMGRFMTQKGFLPLLDALERLASQDTARPYHVVAIGSGDYQGEYKAEAVRRGLRQTITFLPFIPDASQVMGRLDLLVMPSLWEACGLLAMEALSAGVPVIASDCPGLREVLEGTPAVTVAPGDAAALSNTLYGAIADPWTDAARAYAPTAQKRFNASGSASLLREVFHNLQQRHT
jgi:glycosyltransferase involved in cell wall biosynthesis